MRIEKKRGGRVMGERQTMQDPRDHKRIARGQGEQRKKDRALDKDISRWLLTGSLVPEQTK